MALASVQASPTDGSAGAVDAYLLEMYRQAAETTRPTADPRFASLGAFLGFVGVVTVALALLFSIPELTSGPSTPAVCVGLGVLGFLVSIAFYIRESRRLRMRDGESRLDPTDATSSIYQASIGFFGFAVAIATALLLLR